MNEHNWTKAFSTFFLQISHLQWIFKNMKLFNLPNTPRFKPIRSSKKKSRVFNKSSGKKEQGPYLSAVGNKPLGKKKKKQEQEFSGLIILDTKTLLFWNLLFRYNM